MARLTNDKSNAHLQHHVGNGAAEREVEILDRVFIRTNVFLDTAASHHFLVLGRRGCGKTAFSLMEQKSSKGLVAYLNDQGENVGLYNLLAGRVRLEAGAVPDLDSAFAQLWTNLIYLNCMIAADKNAREREENGEDVPGRNHVEALRRHLDTNGLRHRRLIDIVCSAVEETFKEAGSERFVAIGTLAKITRQVRITESSDAVGALRQFARANRGFTIILDMLEHFIPAQEEWGAFVRGMITAVCDFAINPENKNADLMAKLFIPGELYSRVEDPREAKNVADAVFLHWKYHELWKMICRRYIECIVEQRQLHLIEKIDWDDSRSFKDIWRRYFPVAKLYNLMGIEEDALAYVIRHTQKKPREVIVLFNRILDRAVFSGRKESEVTDTDIRDGVSEATSFLAEDNLAIYMRCYGTSLRVLLNSILANWPNVFTHSELNSRLKNVKSTMIKLGLDRDMTKQLLLEMGVMGRVCDKPHQRRDGAIYVAEFEYHLKRNLPLGDDDLFVIHPMFYERFCVKPINRVCVYPRPLNEEDFEEALGHAGGE